MNPFGKHLWKCARKGSLFQKHQTVRDHRHDFQLQTAISPKWIQIAESHDRLAGLWNVGFPSVPLESTQKSFLWPIQRAQKVYFPMRRFAWFTYLKYFTKRTVNKSKDYLTAEEDLNECISSESCRLRSWNPHKIRTTTIFVEYVCYKTVNGYHVSLRRHRSIERNSSLSHLVSTEFSEWNRCWRRTELYWDGWQSYRIMIQYSVGANFVLFVTDWLRNNGNMKDVSTRGEHDVQ